MATATSIPNPSIPTFPCPRCGKNLLTEGFHNSCTETTRLREDNFPVIVNGQLYLEHDEDNLETIDHECDLEAYCSSCELLLPWALYEIRDLDGVDLSEADTVIANLLAALADNAKEGSA